MRARSALALLILLIPVYTRGISEGNLLVVYNSESTDSQAVKDYYLTVRPSALEYDLADNTILTPTVSYADFASKIRDPLRAHLNSNNLQATVEVIVLTKGLPHRIQDLDTNDPNLGDSPSRTITAYNAGKATFASVDSELMLLQYDLDSGESGGSYDSAADNAVLNPYFEATTSFSNFSRSGISSGTQTFSRTGNAYGWWVLGTEISKGVNTTFTPSSPGDIYLTARLDAATVQDVFDMIDRAGTIAFRPEIDAIVLDEDGVRNLDEYNEPTRGALIDDYFWAEDRLSSTWSQVIRDNSATFLIGKAADIPYTDTQVLTGPIAHLHSYGVNHTGTNSQIRPYLATFAGQLVPGASFSAYESFGAKGLGGLSDSGQGQVEEWFASGGTFATGPVWEPFTFGILKSEIFLDRFLNSGLTYVEAAWAGIPQISWQSVVIGDPLATASYRAPTGYEIWVFNNTGTTPDVDALIAFEADFEGDGLANGLEYALGLDPQIADLDGPERPNFTLNSGERNLTFILSNPVPGDLNITVEMSPSLLPDSWISIAERTGEGTWTGSADAIESTTENGNEIQLTDNEPGAAQKRFYRIVVTPTQ